MTAGRLVLTAFALVAFFIVIVLLAGVAHAAHTGAQMVYCCR